MGTDADMRELIASEGANIDMSIMDSKIVKGFQRITGDKIYKIVSLYAYGLIKAKSRTGGHDLVTAAGSAVNSLARDYELDETNTVIPSVVGAAGDGSEYYEGTPLPGNAGIVGVTGLDQGNYFPLSLGQSIIGNFSEVKVLDGPVMVYGEGLNAPTFHLSIAADFALQKANLGLSHTATINHGIIAWFDSTDSSTIQFRLGSTVDVAKWKNKVEPTQYFEQTTQANMPILSNSVDLSSIGGSANTSGMVFGSGGASSWMAANLNTVFLNTSGMRPQQPGEYWTVAIVVSGDAGFNGTLLSRTTWNSGGSYKEHQYHYEVYKTAGGETFFRRTIGETTASGATGSTVNSANLNDSTGVIIASAGYDTSAGTYADWVWINDPSGIAATGGSYNYGNWVNSAATTHLGANIESAGGLSNYLNGTIHEIIILKNRISIGNFSDYGLNSTMVNALMRYFNHKWLGGQYYLNIY